jgi:hypothetical protein
LTGAIIFLVALFLAVVGATVLVVVMRRGLLDEHHEDPEL